MRFGILLVAALFSSLANASLTSAEKSSLRFHLENLRNEVELLVRNQKSEALDIKRQEREFAVLDVFKRIPFEPRVKELEKELRESAHQNGISISKIEILRGPSARAHAPKEVFTDTRRFRFSDEQIAETLQVKITAKAPQDQLLRWTHAWPDDLIRWVEMKGIFHSAQAPAETWNIEAQAFRFRKLRYPRLKPRNPLSLLPDWAREAPQDFAKTEPQLWKFVTEIQQWTKKSSVAYENRRAFFLNDERMSFFMRKTNPRAHS